MSVTERHAYVPVPERESSLRPRHQLLLSCSPSTENRTIRFFESFLHGKLNLNLSIKEDMLIFTVKKSHPLVYLCSLLKLKDNDIKLYIFYYKNMILSFYVQVKSIKPKFKTKQQQAIIKQSPWAKKIYMKGLTSFFKHKFAFTNKCR